MNVGIPSRLQAGKPLATARAIACFQFSFSGCRLHKNISATFISVIQI